MTTKAIRHYPITSAVLNQVEVLAGGIPKADYRFFSHLLADSLRRWKRLQRETVPDFEGGGWIPITRRMIDDGFYVGKGKERQRTNPKQLKELGLIEIYDKYKPDVTAIKYRIAPHIMEAIEVVTLSEPIHTKQPLFDLMTASPWKEKWNVSHESLLPIEDEASSDTPEDPDSPLPRLVERSIDKIRECHYNRDALAQHLEKCRLEYHQAMAGGDTSRADYLRRRLNNDVAIFRELPPHSPFRPVYYPQRSGRIGTPMQNLTGESKAVAYGGIPDLYNYDLSSSQLRICRYYEFPRYGIECSWMNDYLNDSDLRNSYATAIGISPDAFKEAVIGVLMGSRLPRNGTDTAASILQALQDGLPDGVYSSERLEGIVSRFNETITPLKAALNLWHKAIMEKLKKEGILYNALNLSLTLEQVKNHAGGSKRGTIAAHILQGSEALFIHTLTTLADFYGFQVVGNEHDGLLTIGPIPSTAILETQRLTNLECLELREKPFKEAYEGNDDA
jgi:hypothetical protein